MAYRRIPLAVAIIAAISIAVGCREQPITVVPRVSLDYTSIQSIVYSTHVQPIFDRNCQSSGCHNSYHSASGLVLNSWESLFRGASSGAVVVSGNAFMSHLVHAVNDDTALAPVATPRMPLSRDPISREQVAFLMRWIEEGARNDAGQLPFPHPRPKGKLYATNQGADLVAVIDAETNLVMRYVRVGSEAGATALGAPHNVFIDRGGEYFYIILIRAGELWKYRVADELFVGKVVLNVATGDVVVTHDGTKAYVTDFTLGVNAGRTVKVVDTQTMTELRTIDMGSMARSPHGAAISRNGRRLFVVNAASSTVSVINTVNDSLETIVSLDPNLPPGQANLQPVHVAVDPNNRFAYVTCAQSNELRVIDADSMEVVAAIRVGARPYQVAVAPDGGTVWVSNRGGTDVSVVSTQTKAVIGTVGNLPRQPHGIAFSPDGQTAYLTCENQIDPIPPHHPVEGLKTPSFVLVVDVPTLTVVRRIEVGAFAAGIAVTPTPIIVIPGN